MPHPPLTNHGLISDMFIVYPSMRCNTMPTIYFPCAAQAAAQAPPAAAAWSSSSSTTNAAAARTPLEATDFGTRKNRPPPHVEGRQSAPARVARNRGFKVRFRDSGCSNFKVPIQFPSSDPVTM